MKPLINFIYKYSVLSLTSAYMYSRIFNKNLLYDWYKPPFILWISLTNLYLLELLRKDFKRIYV